MCGVCVYTNVYKYIFRLTWCSERSEVIKHIMKKNLYVLWDQSLQSSDPKSDALSIRPHSLQGILLIAKTCFNQALVGMVLDNFVRKLLQLSIVIQENINVVSASAVHILKLERYREDQHGPCARMTRKIVKRSTFLTPDQAEGFEQTPHALRFTKAVSFILILLKSGG